MIKKPISILFLLSLCFSGQIMLAQSTGSIDMERFDNIPNGSLNTLFEASNYPDNPDFTAQLTSFETSQNIGDNYGVRVTGLLHAPETGTYYFWIASDDNSRLELSMDENPINGNIIAYLNSWANPGDWDKYSTQISVGIDLIAGQKYAISAYMKENAGNDHMAVGWRKPSDGPGSAPSEVIPGTVLSTLATTSSIPVTGVSLSSSSLTLNTGDTTMLSATIIPSDASNTNIVWSSSNPTIATVDSTGLIEAFEEGSTTITVTTEDGGLTATTNVTVSNSGNPAPSGSVWSEVNATASYTGDVAIGRSTVPTGYKLAVEGNVRAREIRVDTESWPDYVFSKEYDLPSLEEIQNHIEEKGHLPNIPSAQEVEAHGIEVGEMNRLLLEKIEELTLHVIQLKEEISQLKK